MTSVHRVSHYINWLITFLQIAGVVSDGGDAEGDDHWNADVTYYFTISTLKFIQKYVFSTPVKRLFGYLGSLNDLLKEWVHPFSSWLYFGKYNYINGNKLLSKSSSWNIPPGDVICKSSVGPGQPRLQRQWNEQPEDIFWIEKLLYMMSSGGVFQGIRYFNIHQLRQREV